MERLPSPHDSQRREIMNWKTETRAELQEVLTEPIYRFADRVEALVDNSPEIVNQVAYWRPADEVPYGVHDLPPNLFDHIRTTKPFIPSSSHELNEFINSFWQSNLYLHSNTPGFHGQSTTSEYRENLTANLKRRHNEDIQIDEAEWATYQDSYRAQLERGFYTLGHNAAVMNIPWIKNTAMKRGTFEHMKGNHDTYLLAAMSSPHTVGFYLRVPKGEYGQDFTERLLRATSFLYDFIDQDRELESDFWQRYQTHGRVIDHHTDRAVFNKHLFGTLDSLTVTTQEGIASILAAINLATAQKVKGYDRGEDVLTAIIEEDIPNRLTLLSSLGLAGSAATFGTYFPDLVRNSSGRLILEQDQLDKLNSLRQISSDMLNEEWVEYYTRVAKNGGDSSGIEPPSRTGLSCPAAGPYRSPDSLVMQGAISRLSKTFLKVFECIEPRQEGALQATPWKPPAFIPDNH